MFKLNTLQYPNVQNVHISSDMSLSILENNEEFENLKREFTSKYSYENLKTFSFSKYGFLGLFLDLNKKGKIAVSHGESHAIIQAAKAYEDLGLDLVWIDLQRDGKINQKQIKESNVDFIFISSYVMDTFIKINLEEIKQNTNAKIISNASADFSSFSDAVYFDTYKLSGFALSSVLLFNQNLFDEQMIGFVDTIAVNTLLQALANQKFESSQKSIFKEKLINTFYENIYFFVDSKDTLDFTLHFALSGIKAREIIRTLALNSIHITNGEGCSLGLSKPSRIIQSMGYDELTSRNALSLTFIEKMDEEDIEKIVKTLTKKYRQIKVLNEQ